MTFEEEKKSFKKSNFMTIRPVRAKGFHADKDKQRDRHDDANIRFSQFC